MKNILRSLDRGMIAATLGAAMILLAMMACITFWQVITRFILEQPSKWTEVTSRSCMIWMVYLGLVASLRYGSLIAVETLMSMVQQRARKMLACATALVTLSVLAVLVWQGWTLFERTGPQRLAGLTNPITGSPISISYVYLAVPVGAALSMIAVLARLYEQIRDGIEIDEGPGEHET